MSHPQPRRWVAGLLVSAGVLAASIPPAQAHLVQQAGHGKGSVDWSSGQITVTGSGAPPDRGNAAQRRLLTQRAAVADGYRQLAEIISGVHVDSETVVKDFVTDSDTIRTQVSALVKGAQPGAPRFLSDGAVEIDVTVNLYGQSGLAGITAPDSWQAPGRARDSARPDHLAVTALFALSALVPQTLVDSCHLAAAAVKPVPAKPRPAGAGLSRKPLPIKTNVVPVVVTSQYTGVIIDCKGLGGQPAMSPTILDSSGGEIYLGRRDMPDSFADFVINEGIVGYTDTIAEANQLERAGKNPLRLRATRISGGFKADAVLTDDAAKQLVGAEANSKIMSNAKVVFVL
ncbi:MAG: hypothetical protein H7338_14825 [Candidatus Sericytochromatia bacterium]|nr:hypothetical protein [Candidatus Sericytochromatia bacterium]